MNRQQRRRRQARRRAHALRYDRRGHRRFGYHNAKFDPSFLVPRVNHLAEDVITFVDQYLLDTPAQPWQKRILREVLHDAPTPAERRNQRIVDGALLFGRESFRGR